MLRHQAEMVLDHVDSLEKLRNTILLFGCAQRADAVAMYQDSATERLSADQDRLASNPTQSYRYEHMNFTHHSDET